MPSARLGNGITLPMPVSAETVPSSERFSHENHGESFVLSARTLIPIAFDRQPDIKSSFQRFKSEEARYDFFYTSRDSLTPRLNTSNSYDETREPQTVTREREHVVEMGVEKLFFDTTRLDVGVGFRADAVDEALGNQPFVTARLRYPLWASREKLERTSEEIFWRNQVDDAQLAYIEVIRERLEDTLIRFYDVVHTRKQIENATRWQRDLEALERKLDTIEGRDLVSDRSRLSADLTRVTAEVRNFSGRFDVDLERLKADCGLPFHAKVDLAEEPFNPFEGLTHEELFRLSVEADPEIATLRNAQRNAEVQLDLARRGRWDLALLLNGSSNLDGGGELDGYSEWAVAMGFNVSAVDPRVTNSLIRQAQANIERFRQAIISREDRIYVDTFEPLIRIDTLGQSRDELLGNLPRYRSDYDTGVDEYLAGNLIIDDVLKRRDTLYEQEQEVAYLTFMVGANVAELCAATGKFFELLEPFNGS